MNNADHGGAKHAAADEPPSLEDLSDLTARLTFLSGHHGDRLMVMRVEDFALRIDFLHARHFQSVRELTVGGGHPFAKRILLVFLRKLKGLFETVDDGEEILELINPEIVATEGEQTGPEGCLSVPGKFGMVTRPYRVRVRAQDRNGQWFEAEGEELMARAFCHELEHLDGHLYTEHIDHFLSDEELNERNFFSQLHYMNYWDNGFFLQLNGKFNWASSHYHDEGEEFPGGEMNNKYYQREYYGSVALLYTPHEDWSLSYAADYSFNNLTSNATLGVKPFRHTVLQTLAVRYRTSRLTATALLLGSLYLNEAKGGDPAKDARRLSPSVSVSWKPWALRKLRAWTMARNSPMLLVASGKGP